MGTRGEFKVSITKEDLVFAAAHFITFAGHRCEKLHGHNYRASLVVEGGLEADSWFVVDFSAVKNNRIKERINLQLRFEWFNSTNHPRFDVPPQQQIRP